MWVMFVYKHAYKYAWNSVYGFSQFVVAFDFFSGNKKCKLGTEVALNAA